MHHLYGGAFFNITAEYPALFIVHQLQDNFIEYQIYKDAIGQENNFSYTPSNGISTFGAILSTVGGLFLEL